jgi:hypothetical protein
MLKQLVLGVLIIPPTLRPLLPLGTRFLTGEFSAGIYLYYLSHFLSE